MNEKPTTKIEADILVVDDTPENLRLLNQVLSQQYKVRLAPNGTAGIKAAHSLQPDLILLDILMPDMNGYEVAARLKSDPLTAEIPIIFMSALDDTDSKIRGFSAGGVDYITKPFQEIEVLARVKTHLTIHFLYKQSQMEIAERKQLEKLLRISEERHRLWADNSIDTIWTMNIDGQLTYMSPSIEKLTGYTPEEFIQLPLKLMFTEESWAIVQDGLINAVTNVQAGRPVDFTAKEIEQRRKDGSTIWVEITTTGIYDSDGKFIEFLGITRDISQRKKAEQELQEAHQELAATNSALMEANAELSRLAITDPLTGIWNRRYIQGFVDGEIAQAQRYGKPLSLILFDVDFFKNVNDTYGHKVGDLVLIEISQVVRRNLRVSDQQARWGGEEFVVIVPHCGAAESLALAEKLRGVIASQPFAEVGKVTASFGVAELQKNESFDRWLKRADDALYEAKAIGRNTVRLAA